jgi:hypothetical protein
MTFYKPLLHSSFFDPALIAFFKAEEDLTVTLKLAFIIPYGLKKESSILPFLSYKPFF